MVRIARDEKGMVMGDKSKVYDPVSDSYRIDEELRDEYEKIFQEEYEYDELEGYWIRVF
jgi:hypothetical protein